MGTWTNSDGLTIYYGLNEATKAVGGFFEDTVAGANVLEFLIPDLTVLTTTAVDQGINMFVPSGMRLVKTEVNTETGATGTGATLNIGFFDKTSNSTVSDTGAVAALALTAITTAGQQVSLITGATSAGALQGLAVGTAGHIVSVTAKYATAAFTAGAVRVKLFFERTLTTD